MNNLRFIIVVTLLIFCLNSYGQSSKTNSNFSKPLLVDSNSTVIIPTVYESGLLSSNKMTLWGDYYSNIIFYNFKNDTYKRLFEKDTYIVGFNPNTTSYSQKHSSDINITSTFILYQVKNIDFNFNKKIDNKDPAVLYVTDLHGNNLKRITAENENVISFEVFEKQKFALVKIQRDINNDKNFDSGDSDYYFIKLDLTTFQLGNKIEIKL